MNQELVMTTEQILSLPVRARAMFAIDLMNELFELHDCYSSLNFSRYMNNVCDEIVLAFEQQGCADDLSFAEKRDRLMALLNSLQFDVDSLTRE